MRSFNETLSVWVERDFDGTFFIGCERHFDGDLVEPQFGCMVACPMEPTEVEGLFPTFTDHGEACAALRAWADGWDA